MDDVADAVGSPSSLSTFVDRGSDDEDEPLREPEHPLDSAVEALVAGMRRHDPQDAADSLLDQFEELHADEDGRTALRFGGALRALLELLDRSDRGADAERCCRLATRAVTGDAAARSEACAAGAERVARGLLESFSAHDSVAAAANALLCALALLDPESSECSVGGAAASTAGDQTGGGADDDDELVGLIAAMRRQQLAAEAEPRGPFGGPDSADLPCAPPPLQELPGGLGQPSVPCVVPGVSRRGVPDLHLATF